MKRSYIRNDGSSERGFTLFELLIVLAIIMIAGMFAIPNVMEARENYELLTTAGDVVASMNRARISAINQNKDFRVRVDSTTSYVIEEGPSWSTVSTTGLPDGFVFTASGGTATFHARGNATLTPGGQVNADGQLELTLQNSNGLTRDVIIDPSGHSNSE